LILIDARAHGRSDKPHQPQAYRKALWPADVTVVLDDLGVDKAHFIGYSMGASIGFVIAKYAPQRFHSLILGGYHPYERDPDEPDPDQEGGIERWRMGVDVYVAALKPVYGQWWNPAMEAIIRANDPEAQIAQSTLRERVGIVDALPGLMVPCLIYAGENDDNHSNAKRASEIIPNATFVSLPGLDHVATFFRSDLVVPHVREFLAAVGEG